MAEIRHSGTWGSALSTDEFAAIRSAGFEPVGQVLGAAVYNVGYTGGYACPGAWAGYGSLRRRPYGASPVCPAAATWLVRAAGARPCTRPAAPLLPEQYVVSRATGKGKPRIAESAPVDVEVRLSRLGNLSP